ncbi:hypothetical protein PR202_gb16249 [Eleusine coracana subsp. coracana]|uniref:Retrotransposon gag domain-containing protein n=1 Tax=Eleusine coracana subsp. coracana TaxID=191504 RepID=A0AAV5EZX8_ELECO|nr:hypothetical protein PR202_gb16249 [Eleusine coracana subsp. coracana]
MDETPSTLTTRSALGTTDAMRKSGMNEGWIPDGKTSGTTDEKTDGTTNGMIVRILRQETNATTNIDMTIGIGVIMMAIDNIVMMRMLAHATVVAQPRFKPVPIEKYDGQTNPREWLQLYSTAIQSAGGDSYVMANYLPVCLDPAVRIWLTSLPEESVTSWGDLNRKLIECFQATCNRPGNHFDLTRIKQKGDKPLRDYIKRFCAKKAEIPNVPDQQIITAFLGGIRSDDLVREIGRRNHDLKLTAQECFEIADKYASGESALDDIRGKGKEKWSDMPESSKKDKKRKPDNAVNIVDRFWKNPRTNQPSTDELLSAAGGAGGIARGVGAAGPVVMVGSTTTRAVSCPRARVFRSASSRESLDHASKKVGSSGHVTVLAVEASEEVEQQGAIGDWLIEISESHGVGLELLDVVKDGEVALNNIAEVSLKGQHQCRLVVVEESGGPVLDHRHDGARDEYRSHHMRGDSRVDQGTDRRVCLRLDWIWVLERWGTVDMSRGAELGKHDQGQLTPL